MSLLYWLESIRTPALDAFFSAITHLGSETVFLAVAIVVFWCVSKKYGYYLMTVGFYSTIINQFLKMLCAIPRPWVRDPSFTIVESAREGASGYSFPSGHTQSVTAVLGCPARFTKHLSVRIICIVLILLTAFSRMYLGVHTPADVLAGLLISGVLVWKLWPVFEKSDDDLRPMLQALVMLAFLAVAFVLYMELHSWSADTDAHNLQSATKNAYLLLGAGWGMIAALVIEKRHINFDPRAPWWAQILKTVVGLALVLALKAGLKPVLALVFGDHHAATALRYFLLVLFAGCVWPLTFRWFASGCGLRRKNGA